MIELQNYAVHVWINEVGAEVRRMTVDGTDVLWSGDAAVWSGVSPILFPICSGMAGDVYTVGGKEYSMGKHGFARGMEFKAVERGSRFVSLRLTDTPETRKQYPWQFALTVTYRLHGKRLDVTYTVENKSDTAMYFSEGSHEGYACPEGIEEYDVIFEKEETLSAYAIDGVRLKPNPTPMLYRSRVFPLYEKYFKVDALVFNNLQSRSAALRHRPTGREITVDFPGCDYFLLWQKCGAKYICMEPWCGICGTVGDGIAFEEKEGMICLLPGERYERTHTVRA